MCRKVHLHQALVTLHVNNFNRPPPIRLFVSETKSDMRKIPATCFILMMLLISYSSFARQDHKTRLFIECTEGGLCNLDFIRKELPVVDFVQDRFQADVHVLIVTQPAGNAGSAHTILFIGQNPPVRQDTALFYTSANATEDENRKIMIRHVKMGLMPWLVRSRSAGLVDISFREQAAAGDAATTNRDRWKGWVFMMGGRLSLNGDRNYHEHSIGIDASATKVTASYKTGLSFYQSSSKNQYSYMEAGEKVTLKTLNEYRYIKHDFVKSLGPRWSAGYEVEYVHSTYDNYRHGYSFSPGIEYNIFPYSLSSSKFLAIRYRLEGERRVYLEETLFDKEREWLFSHELGAYTAFAQKWGSIYGSLNWYNYVHDFSKNNLSFYIETELRLVKGLMLTLYTSASIINDQLNISKAGADPQEVLLKLKALSTSYNYNTGIGLRYRFGSAFNNIVNPRFTNGRY